MTDKTKVIFRVFKDGGDLIAIMAMMTGTEVLTINLYPSPMAIA